MRIATGPIALACPGWGLDRGTVTALAPDGEDGRPDVLAAQILISAAQAGSRVLMLLPGDRSTDRTWSAMISMLADGDHRAAGREMGRLPIAMHSWGTGWDKAQSAELVYAPGLSVRDVRRLKDLTDAPIILLGKALDGESSNRPAEIIRVSGEQLSLPGRGFAIPVVYDPSGPIYRPA